MPFPVRSVTPEVLYAEGRLPLDSVLVDVRTPEEIRQDAGEPGCICLDFLDARFEHRLEELDRLVPYFLFCDTGKRSRKACEWMASRGFTLVAWVEGGKPALDRLQGQLHHRGV